MELREKIMGGVVSGLVAKTDRMVQSLIKSYIVIEKTKRVTKYEVKMVDGSTLTKEKYAMGGNGYLPKAVYVYYRANYGFADVAKGYFEARDGLARKLEGKSGA